MVLLSLIFLSRRDQVFPSHACNVSSPSSLHTKTPVPFPQAQRKNILQKAPWHFHAGRLSSGREAAHTGMNVRGQLHAVTELGQAAPKAVQPPSLGVPKPLGSRGDPAGQGLDQGSPELPANRAE